MSYEDDIKAVRDALFLLGKIIDFDDISVWDAATAALNRIAAENERRTRELDEAREACEKAIRERRSLERKEDDWHSAYERKKAEKERLRAVLKQIRRKPWIKGTSVCDLIDDALAGGVGDTAA